MSAYQLQIAVYNALTGDATLMGKVRGVYDNPGQVDDPSDNTEFPFITISEGTDSSWDTDTESGFDATVQVHVWSRAHHSMEAKDIQDAVYNVLHRATLTITGYAFIGCDMTTRTYPQRDPDGITRHGVQEFRITYDEVV